MDLHPRASLNTNVISPLSWNFNRAEKQARVSPGIVPTSLAIVRSRSCKETRKKLGKEIKNKKNEKIDERRDKKMRKRKLKKKIKMQDKKKRKKRQLKKKIDINKNKNISPLCLRYWAPASLPKSHPYSLTFQHPTRDQTLVKVVFVVFPRVTVWWVSRSLMKTRLSSFVPCGSSCMIVESCVSISMDSRLRSIDHLWKPAYHPLFPVKIVVW